MTPYSDICVTCWRNWEWQPEPSANDFEFVPLSGTAHLMRMAGRFARRIRAFAKANAIPVVDCAPKEKKFEIARTYWPSTMGGQGCS